MRQCNMSLSEADRLEAYLKGISGVIEVKVYRSPVYPASSRISLAARFFISRCSDSGRKR